MSYQGNATAPPLDYIAILNKIMAKHDVTLYQIAKDTTVCNPTLYNVFNRGCTLSRKSWKKIAKQYNLDYKTGRSIIKP
jgi:hypothetical protein